MDGNNGRFLSGHESLCWRYDRQMFNGPDHQGLDTYIYSTPYLPNDAVTMERRTALDELRKKSIAGM